MERAMEVKIEQSTNRRGNNWVARIIGIHPKYGLKREFVAGTVVPPWVYYQLADGIYEISLGKTLRYFIRITGGEKTKLTADEVMSSAIREMRSIVIISKRGSVYFSDAHGQFGGGHSGARAGLTAEEAAIAACKLMLKYGKSNPAGADLVAPDEVLSRVPESLRSIPARGDAMEGN